MLHLLIQGYQCPVTGEIIAMDSPRVAMLESILKNENGIMGYYLMLFMPKNIPTCLSFHPLEILHYFCLTYFICGPYCFSREI